MCVCVWGVGGCAIQRYTATVITNSSIDNWNSVKNLCFSHFYLDCKKNWNSVKEE